MKTLLTIPKVGKLHVYRREQFPYKQIVSDYIIDLIKLSAKNAKKHIDITGYTTFCYGELQLHSIIVPAIAKLSSCFIFEYPIQRGKQISSGRVDYYCINKEGEANEYRLFLELKYGRQGIPTKKLRARNIDLWQNANKQLDGITQEIKLYRDYYDKPIVRVCMEAITFYADESKIDKIDSDVLKEVFKSSIDTLTFETGLAPNIGVLWEFHPDIVKEAMDEYREARKFFGIMFLCRVIPPIMPK